MPGAVTRRSLFAAGGLMAMAGFGGEASAEAPPPTAEEAANLALAQNFCRAWGEPGFDPDKVMPTYLAPASAVRVIDSAPFVTGPAGAAAAFKPFMAHGERFQVRFLSTFVRGPLVMTHRIDTQVAPGQADKSWEMVGVFLVHDGKIKEWTDYVVG